MSPLALVRCFRALSVPLLRIGWGRSVLIVAGVAVGVSLIVAISLINESVVANFRRQLDLITGPAKLEIRHGSGEIGFDEAVREQIDGTAGVAASVPTLLGTVALASDPSVTLQVVGTDLANEDALRRLDVGLQAETGDRLAWLDDPQSIALSRAFAAERALHLGDTVTLATPRGTLPFRIRGLLEDRGLAGAYGGRVALADIVAAQWMLHRDRQVDAIALVLDETADVEAVRRIVQARIPPALTVARPAQRAELFDRFVSSFQSMVAGIGLLCLVAAGYIIYSTTATGAAHRAVLMANLNVVGASPRQLFVLLMLESIVLGVVGASIGVLSGLVLSRLLISLVCDSMGVIFQLRFWVDEWTTSPTSLAAAGAYGLAVTLLASFLAVRNVLRLEPLTVIRADPIAVVPRADARRLSIVWLVLVVVAGGMLVLAWQRQSAMLGNVASTVWCGASIVIAIPLISWLGPAIARRLEAVLGLAGRIGAESLFRSPTRTGVTVAAIALVLVVGVTAASLSSSHRRSVDGYVTSGFLSSDVIVSAGMHDGGWLPGPLPADVGEALRRVDGVDRIDALRILPGVLYDGQRIAVAGIAEGTMRRLPDDWFERGDPASARRALIDETGVLISENFARHFAKGPGDVVRVDTPTGPADLKIAGTIRDYISDRGSIVLGQTHFRRLWHDEMANMFFVFVRPDVDVAVVRRRIEATLGARHQLALRSDAEFRTYLSAKIREAYRFVDAILLLIVLVTVCGVFDMLVAAIWERRRELSLWQLVGAEERMLRRSVVYEGLVIGVAGVALGLLVGALTSWMWARVNYRILLGYDVRYHFDGGAALTMSVLVLAVTALAAWAAARRASRQSILDGIAID